MAPMDAVSRTCIAMRSPCILTRLSMERSDVVSQLYLNFSCIGSVKYWHARLLHDVLADECCCMQSQSLIVACVFQGPAMSLHLAYNKMLRFFDPALQPRPPVNNPPPPPPPPPLPSPSKFQSTHVLHCLQVSISLGDACILLF